MSDRSNLFILLNFLSQTVRERIALFTSKHITYPYFLHRHRLLGPWTRSDVLIQLIYITTNNLCLGFRVPILSKAGLRAGNLSLANMVPLFAGPHLSFLADVLGFRLDSYRYVHRSAGTVAIPCPRRGDSANIVLPEYTGASLRNNRMFILLAHAVCH